MTRDDRVVEGEKNEEVSSGIVVIQGTASGMFAKWLAEVGI